MLRAKLGEHPNNIGAAVLSQRARDHFHRARDRLHGVDGALLVSPWTSDEQLMSPSTDPSMCRSAEALISPVIAVSEPKTEKVELPLLAMRSRPGLFG